MWEHEEQEETPHQSVAAHQPAVVPLAKVKVRRGVHLDEQGGVARRQDTEKNPTAQEENAIVLAHATIGVPDPLGGHDLERGKEPADTLLTTRAALLAVRKGLGWDERQDHACVDGGGQK